MKKLILAICAMFVCFFVCGCDSHPDEALARVNDTFIYQDQIDKDINQLKQRSNLNDANAWQKYLVDNKTTEQNIRKAILDNEIEKEVKRQIAKDKDIEPTQAEINGYIEAEIQASGSQEAFNKSLDVSLDEHKQYVSDIIIDNKVYQKLVADSEPSNASVGKMLVNYSDKFDGSTGYYQLIFRNDNKARAQSFLDNIKSGKISFEDATVQATEQDKEKINFDYVIYTCFIRNPQEVNDQLNKLNVGEMSDLIVTDNYTYIVKVVDKIHCDNPLTSLNKLPDYTRSNIESYSKIEDADNLYNKAYEAEKSQMNIRKYVD